MYKCLKFLKKIFKSLKKNIIFSKIKKIFFKAIPKKILVKYIRNMYFKKNKESNFKKNTFIIKMKYLFFEIFKNYE